jgi:hypothetical protein
LSHTYDNTVSGSSMYINFVVVFSSVLRRFITV